MKKIYVKLIYTKIKKINNQYSLKSTILIIVRNKILKIKMKITVIPQVLLIIINFNKKMTIILNTVLIVIFQFQENRIHLKTFLCLIFLLSLLTDNQVLIQIKYQNLHREYLKNFIETITTNRKGN